LKYDRNCGGRLLSRERGPGVRRGNDHIDPALHEIGGQHGQSITMRFRPTIQNIDVAPCEEPGLTEATVKCGSQWPHRKFGAPAEKTDHWSLLLRPQPKKRRRKQEPHRTASACNERAPPYHLHSLLDHLVGSHQQ
jgi:hypothetical protein